VVTHFFKVDLENLVSWSFELMIVESSRTQLKSWQLSREEAWTVERCRVTCRRVQLLIVIFRNSRPSSTLSSAECPSGWSAMLIAFRVSFVLRFRICDAYQYCLCPWPQWMREILARKLEKVLMRSKDGARVRV
jgi:hypothetical protein